MLLNIGGRKRPSNHNAHPFFGIATTSYDGMIRLYDRNFKAVVGPRKAPGGRVGEEKAERRGGDHLLRREAGYPGDRDNGPGPNWTISRKPITASCRPRIQSRSCCARIRRALRPARRRRTVPPFISFKLLKYKNYFMIILFESPNGSP